MNNRDQIPQDRYQAYRLRGARIESTILLSCTTAILSMIAASFFPSIDSKEFLIGAPAAVAILTPVSITLRARHLDNRANQLEATLRE